MVVAYSGLIWGSHLNLMEGRYQPMGDMGHVTDISPWELYAILSTSYRAGRFLCIRADIDESCDNGSNQVNAVKILWELLYPCVFEIQDGGRVGLWPRRAFPVSTCMRHFLLNLLLLITLFHHGSRKTSYSCIVLASVLALLLHEDSHKQCQAPQSKAKCMDESVFEKGFFLKPFFSNVNFNFSKNLHNGVLVWAVW